MLDVDKINEIAIFKGHTSKTHVSFYRHGLCAGDYFPTQASLDRLQDVIKRGLRAGTIFASELTLNRICVNILFERRG